MYQLIIYETTAGNKPFCKFMDDLLDKHKDDEVTRIKAMLDKLEEYGFKLNDKVRKSIKPIREQVYELRVLPNRVFFFHFKDDKFIILHGFEKKSNKTPNNQIDKAIEEKNDFIRRNKS